MDASLPNSLHGLWNRKLCCVFGGQAGNQRFGVFCGGHRDYGIPGSGDVFFRCISPCCASKPLRLDDEGGCIFGSTKFEIHCGREASAKYMDTVRVSRGTERHITLRRWLEVESRENILPIDTRLRIFWPKDNQFYPGKVSGHETANGFFYHAIEYDDGMIETRLNMAQELYAVIPAGRPRDPRLPHHQKAVQPPPGTVTPETGSGLVGMERDTAQMQMTMTGNASLAGNLPQHQKQQQQQQQVEERLQSTEVVNNDEDDEDAVIEQPPPQSLLSGPQLQVSTEEINLAKRKYMETQEAMFDNNVRYLEEKRLRYTAQLNARNTEKQLEEETKRRQVAEAVATAVNVENQKLEAALKEEEKKRQAAQTAAAAVKAEKEQLEEEVKARRAEIADFKEQMVANVMGWKGFEAHSG